MRIIIWVEFHHETIDQVHTVIQRSCLDAQILVPEYEYNMTFFETISYQGYICTIFVYLLHKVSESNKVILQFL